MNLMTIKEFEKRGGYTKEERAAIIREMWPDRKNTRAMIATRLGISDTYVSIIVSELGLEPRISQLAIKCGRPKDYLRIEADRRGISIALLKKLLLDAIVNDKMVNAVLDDQ